MDWFLYDDGLRHEKVNWAGYVVYLKFLKILMTKSEQHNMIFPLSISFAGNG